MLFPSYHRLRLIVALALALANSSYAQVNIINAVELNDPNYFYLDTVTMAGGTLTFPSTETSNLFTFGGLAAAQTGTCDLIGTFSSGRLDHTDHMDLKVTK